MSKKVMRLLDGRTGLMECKVCGSRHLANMQHGGGYVRGSWQVPPRLQARRHEHNEAANRARRSAVSGKRKRKRRAATSPPLDGYGGDRIKRAIKIDGTWYIDLANGEHLPFHGLTDEHANSFNEGAKQFAAAVASRDWNRLHPFPGSQERLPGLRWYWPNVPPAERAAELVVCISLGDAPVQEPTFLIRVLGELLRAGERLFDSDAARTRFEALPDVVTIHRGTNKAEAEGRIYGVCWTLDRDKAVFFACSTHASVSPTRRP